MTDERDQHKETGGQLLEVEQRKPRRPRKYHVVLLNDDYTPMVFVVWLLRVLFHKSDSEAQALMWRIHSEGRGVCGVYAYDIARTKQRQVAHLAEQHGHPLQCVLEVAEGV